MAGNSVGLKYRGKASDRKDEPFYPIETQDPATGSFLVGFEKAGDECEITVDAAHALGSTPAALADALVERYTANGFAWLQRTKTVTTDSAGGSGSKE